jgi:hypothetical protein
MRTVSGWRVDGGTAGGGTQSNTARTVLVCPWDRSERDSRGRVINRMFVDQEPNSWSSDPRLNDEDSNRLWGFHNRLFRDGYHNSPGLLPIIDLSHRNTPFNEWWEVQPQHFPLARTNHAPTRAAGNDIWQRPYNFHSALLDGIVTGKLTDFPRWYELPHP